MMSNDASELLVALDPEHAHVVGTSVGGFIAQLLTLDHPDLVASLTLISTRPVDPDLPGHAPGIIEQLFGLAEPDWADRNSVVDYMTDSARLKSGSAGFNVQDARTAAGPVFDRAGRTAKAQRASHLGTMFAALDCPRRWCERLGIGRRLHRRRSSARLQWSKPPTARAVMHKRDYA